jgi:hypothetical protein
MAKGRKMRTLRKKMSGGQEKEEKKKYSFSPIDISETTYKSKISESPLGTETIYGETGRPINISRYTGVQDKKGLSTMVDEVTLTKDDVMGGKLRRTRKRRMTKRRKNSRKSRKSKSRKMRRGGTNPNFFDLSNEYNSTFENQPRNGAQPIKIFPEKEYVEFRNNPTKYATEKPVADITIKEKSSWLPFQL